MKLSIELVNRRQSPTEAQRFLILRKIRLISLKLFSFDTYQNVNNLHYALEHCQSTHQKTLKLVILWREEK